ncbi:MAG: hypothetical protein AB8B79_06100 [Granulosicoccus sp.]
MFKSILQSMYRFRIGRFLAASILVLCASANTYAQSVIDIAVGGQSLCAITEGGQLSCTTRFDRSVHLPPNDGTLYQSVASGASHSCAITEAGAIRCWGENGLGQLDVPAADVDFIKLDAQDNHTCAIDAASTVHCWGLNTNEQTDPPSDNTGFVEIFTGETGSCGIKDSGQTVCWSNERRHYDTSEIDSVFTDLVIGGGGSGKPACGLNTNGAIDCWFTTEFSVEQPPGDGFVDIDANGVFFCGVLNDGGVSCSFRTFSSGNSDDEIRIQNQISAWPAMASIEISRSAFPDSSICGISQAGEMLCAGSRLPALELPTEASTLLEPPTNVRFISYSDTEGELVWDARDIAGTVGLGYNIYKNDNLLALTANNGSFYDGDLERGVSYRYTVAAVNFDGDPGDLSNEAIRPGEDPSDTAQDSSNLNLVGSGNLRNLIATRYGFDTLELFWEPAQFQFKNRYEIHRNGVFIKTVFGPSFFDDNAPENKPYHYTIVDVSNSGKTNGIGIVSVEAGTENQCY